MALKATGAVAVGLCGVATFRYRQILDREKQLPEQVLSVFPPVSATTTSINSSSPNNKKKKVVIVGAGVVGVATAYKLAARGHQVAILEPRPAPGEECSACAAGGMQRSNPVVDKDSWMAVLKCVSPFHDSGYRFFHIDWSRTITDPFFLRWLWTFTQTSLMPPAEQQDKQRAMLDFTDYAVQDMVNMMEDPQDKGDIARKSGYNKRGSLAVSYDEPGVVNEKDNAEPSKKKADNPTQSKRNLEPYRVLVGTENILKEEPSLRFQERLPTQAKFEYESKSANSERFAKELARRCATHPQLKGLVTFFYDTKVEAIDTTTRDNGSRRITHLRTNQGVIVVPEEEGEVVVAAGAWTPHVFAKMDLYAPVYPLKGYAMSVSVREALQQAKQSFTLHVKSSELPSRIVCDPYMFTSRLGDDEIRITSIGEFSAWETKPTSHVEVDFRHEAKRQFPQLTPVIDSAKTKCGHRPLISDGLLLLGKCKDDTVSNLYVTCGPGSNGWKLALGSGDIVARLMSGQTLEQIHQEIGVQVRSFEPAGRVLYAPFFAKLCRARWNV